MTKLETLFATAAVCGFPACIGGCGSNDTAPQQEATSLDAGADADPVESGTDASDDADGATEAGDEADVQEPFAFD